MAKLGFRSIALVFAVVFLQSCSRPAGTLSPIIPAPERLTQGQGHFTIQPTTVILVDPDDEPLRRVAAEFVQQFNRASGFALQVSIAQQQRPDHCIQLTRMHADPSTGAEGYELSVRENGIQLRAPQPAGIFYGLQSLRQLLPAEFEKSAPPPAGVIWKVPAVQMVDKPRFGWRGVLLDVSRHFHPKPVVKKVIDILALHKMNVLQMHLTDDQGWRIEIKKYPKLTQIGSWRADRSSIPWNDREAQKKDEQATYGGFYTQEDIRELVAYAQSRFVTIIPEIEMPAHAVAALASYPHYSCSGGPFTVVTGGYWPLTDIYCAGNDQTFAFLQDVLDEVMQLFPGTYIHIGGDEADKANWKKCSRCQARIKKEGLKDEEELQSYFVQRIEKYLNSKGRVLIGWDEILSGGLAPNAVVMSWRGMEGGIAAANAGHDVIMTPTSYCYFDYLQGKNGEPPGIGGFLPLEKVYQLEPIPQDISADKRHHILGAQANLWAEYISNGSHVEYMLLPRLAALAEAVWSVPAQRNYQNFLQRLPAYFDRLAGADINFRVPVPDVAQTARMIFTKTQVIMKPGLAGSKIVYTLDGSEPSPSSPVYDEPFNLSTTTLLQARTLLANGRMSPVITLPFYQVQKNINGLSFRYYEGEWDRLPDFSTLQSARQGFVYDFDFTAIPAREDHFAVRYQTLVEIPADGHYTFYLSSNDGSKLYLNDRLVVDNDGPHNRREKSAGADLKAGRARMTVEYFEIGGMQELQVSYEGPGLARQVLPPDRMFRP
jgi:hexosaminidase